MKFKHFVALTFVDVILTYYAITYMNVYEGNPILNAIFAQIGLIAGLVLPKLIGIGVIGTIKNHMPLKIKTTTINIICYMYVLVVLNNSYQILWNW